MNEKALCTARELAIGYGKTPLLSDICLGVQPGQILTLIGPNGAGKSTLLKTLAGQLAPLGGAAGGEGSYCLYRNGAGQKAGSHGSPQPPDGADHLL